MTKAKAMANNWQQAASHLARADSRLGRVIKKAGPCRLRRKQGGCATMAETILRQQLSGKAADSIIGRVRKLTPTGHLTAEGINTLSDRQMRQCGVSMQKVQYLRDLAVKINSGQLVFARLAGTDDEAVITVLTQVKGIGRWSAEMYLIFVLNRPDVFSPGDTGLKNAIDNLYDLPDDTEYALFAERWAPYRTVACWYLWESLRL
jgi:DNA-3-methyladenine glycosylase II